MTRGMLTLDHLLSMKEPGVRSTLALSPDGRHLAFCAQDAYAWGSGDLKGGFTSKGVSQGLQATRIRVLDVTTGRSHEPFPHDSVNWAPQWSPDGTRLAAFVQHVDYVCLGVWERESGTFRLYREATARPGEGPEFLRWTPDSGSIVMRIVDYPDAVGLASPDAPRVKVYASQADDGIAPARIAHRVDLAFHMVRIDVGTGATDYLLRGCANFIGCQIAPDGHAVATFTYSDNDTTTGRSYWDLVLACLDGSEARVLAKGVPTSWGVAQCWSPDSRMLAFLTGGWHETPRLHVVPADGSSEPQELPIPDGVTLHEQYECPRWSDDGKQLLCRAQEGICIAQSDGTGSRLVPPSEGWRFASWIQPALTNQLTMSGPDAVAIQAYAAESGRSAVARLDLQSGQVTPIAELAGRFPNIAGGGGLLTNVSSDGAACYVVTASGSAPAELWQVTTSVSPRRLFSFCEGLADLDLGEVRQIEWQTEGGQTLRGVLLLPPGYRDGERVPMIVEAYAGRDGASFLYDLAHAGLMMNPYLLAARGYAVLYPDIPLSGPNPYRQIAGPVLGAVNEVVRMGIADPERLGVIGQSYGGYTVFSLIAETSVFRAAVANAGIVNMLSHYTWLHQVTGSDNGWYCETGQGGIGCTPWENLDAYVQNSPFFFLDRVTTPVLVSCGAEDSHFARQAQEAFVALRRLGKRAELRIYEGEGHFPSVWSEPHFRDFTDRVISWFDEFLC